MRCNALKEGEGIADSVAGMCGQRWWIERWIYIDDFEKKRRHDACVPSVISSCRTARSFHGHAYQSHPTTQAPDPHTSLVSCSTPAELLLSLGDLADRRVTHKSWLPLILVLVTVLAATATAFHLLQVSPRAYFLKLSSLKVRARAWR